MNIDDLLGAYDEQLRTDAETPSAVTVVAMGPLRRNGTKSGPALDAEPLLEGLEAADYSFADVSSLGALSSVTVSTSASS